MICSFYDDLHANTLEVGQGYPYATLSEATNIAVPGDTILIHEGTYSGGIYVADLQGTASAWIHILAAPGEAVTFDGGGNAWQFTDAAYLEISGFIFEHQTGNGVNFDDGGSYETPSHHILFDNCTFRDINASGNNDLLKLSGIDSFEIRQCLFLNGAEGGSGIDMVGCHDSQIHNNRFENQGSNSVQAKGGCRNIRIERNFFKNGGARALNLGGSTGLQFFRPLDAPYEAAELKVYSNVFIGSDAPVAFVGTINTEVVNNTFYLPTKWVLRILQETVDPDRFPPCGYNTFRNNIIYINNLVSVECNIGPNTAPETFTFSNNLWFHSENSNWTGPDLPVEDTDNIVSEDPLFEDASLEDFSLMEGSPAIGAGYDVTDPSVDYDEVQFLIPRSIGAFEGGMATGIVDYKIDDAQDFRVWPNPASSDITIEFPGPQDALRISLVSISGQQVLNIGKESMDHRKTITMPLNPDLHGLFVLRIESDEWEKSQILVIE
ncbi:MAG: right-handed parallel beta-helix repeat-containing protein [Saprospiraceae bacterium]|nr:right-handed parallel beta-helix repeat-containing protein [Candidatus Opimibacter iunctus]